MRVSIKNIKFLNLKAFSFFSYAALTATANAESVDYGNLATMFDEPITVSATGKPQKTSEVPVSVDIITADQIRRMGVTSLPEIIGRLPGVTNWQANRNYADVGVRGQNLPYNPSLLVLVNGRQVYTDSYGSTDWSLIPVEMEEVRQIEVIKNPSTALYGFNAVNGVVNIITYNPKYDKFNQAGIVAGTGNYKRAYGIKTIKLSDDASLRVSVGDENSNEFTKHSKAGYLEGMNEFQSNSNRKVSTDGLIQLNNTTELRLEGAYSDSKGADSYPSYASGRTNRDFIFGKATLIKDSNIGQLETSVYTNRYIINLDDADDNDAQVVNYVTVAQVQDLFKLGTDHTFRLQLEYRYNTLDSDSIIGPGANLNYNVIAEGAMWNWVITPKLEWTNAARLDHLMLSRDGPLRASNLYSDNDAFDQTITDYSLNSGLMWKATPLDTFRLSYARGIQIPSLFGLGSDYKVAPNFYLTGNPYANTTVVSNYELGYDRHIDAIGGKFSGALFYRNSDNIGTTAGRILNSNGNMYELYDSVGDSETRGVQFGFDGNFDANWIWDVNYVYQNTVDSLLPSAAGDPSTQQVHFHDTIPHHVLKAHLGYVTGRWETDFYGEATSDFSAEEAKNGTFSPVDVDGYQTLGGRIGYNLDDGVTLALQGTGLTQARTVTNYGLENNREIYFSISKKF